MSKNIKHAQKRLLQRYTRKEWSVNVRDNVAVVLESLGYTHIRTAYQDCCACETRCTVTISSDMSKVTVTKVDNWIVACEVWTI